VQTEFNVGHRFVLGPGVERSRCARFFGLTVDKMFDPDEEAGT
jgi:hypothetical protein